MSAVTNLPITMIQNIGPYEVSRLLGKGATSHVFLVQRDGKSFALKLFKSSNSKTQWSDKARFRKEGEFLSRVKNDGVVEVIEMGEHDSDPYLVMELLKGRELAEFKKNDSLSMVTVRQIGISIAQGLSEIHRASLVHQDLKPENIFVDEKLSCKIIDFGFTHELNSIVKELPEKLGTPQYCSPEQLGIINSVVDYRSDLFSLGVILFELLAKKSPWGGASLNEIVRSHSEKIPDLSGLNPLISKAFGQIVQKLLEQDPNKRYQTAEGVIVDLQKIEELDQQLSIHSHCQLGANDFRMMRSNEMPLIGREKEIEKLKTSLNHLSHGKGDRILIEGEPGSGKTHLIKSFFLLSGASSPFVLAAKCHLAEQTPYAVIRDLLDTLVRRALDDPKNVFLLQGIRRSAVGSAAIAGSLSLPLSTLIGSENIPLRSQMDQVQFNLGVAEFFTNLAKELRGLTLFIDDIQWLDQASHFVVHQMLESVETIPVLLIMSARSNQTSQAAVNKSIEKWGGASPERMPLQKLSFSDIRLLTENLLGGKGFADDLLFKLYNRVEGNPFAIMQFIFSMLDSKVIVRKDGAWNVDTEKFDGVVVSGNVISVVLERLSKIEIKYLQAIKIAAVLSKDFTEEMIESIHSGASTKLAIKCFLTLNLIEKTEDGNFSFIHDRVREAVLEKIELDELRELHQAIALAMEAKSIPSDPYAVADHFYLGTVAKNPLKVVQSNMYAGAAAKEEFAAGDAIKFYERAKELISDFNIELSDIERAQLLEHLGFNHWRAGNGQKAIEYFKSALQETQSDNSKGRLHFMMGQAHYEENQGVKGWNEVELGLGVFGIKIPKTTIQRELLSFLFWVMYMVSKYLPFLRLAARDEGKNKIILSLLNTGGFASFVSLRWSVTRHLVPRILFYAWPLRNRVEAVDPLSFYCIYLGIKKNIRALKKMSALVMSLAERSGNFQQIALARFRIGVALHCAGLPLEAEKFQIETANKFDKWLTPRVYLVNSNDLVGCNMLIRGFANEALNLTQKTLRHSAGADSVSVRGVSACLALGPHAVLGNSFEVEQLSKTINDNFKETSLQSLDWCWNHAHRTVLALETGVPIEDFFERLDSFWDRVADAKNAPIFFKPFFLYSTHYLLKFHYVGSKTAPEIKNRVELAFIKLKSAATMPHWRAHYFFLLGQKAVIDGSLTRARGFLWLAENYARKTKNIWVEFLILQARAEIDLKNGKSMQSEKNFRLAESIARVQRWPGRLVELKKKFNHEQIASQIPGDTLNLSEPNLTLEVQFKTILKLSEIASANLDFGVFSKRALEEVASLFGAERAFILKAKSGSNNFDINASYFAEPNRSDTNYSVAIVKKAINSKKVVFVTGTDQSEMSSSQSMIIQSLKNIVVTPLFRGSRLIGALYLDSKLESSAFSRENLAVLDIVSSQLALFIDKVQASDKLKLLHQLSMSTSLYSDILGHSKNILDEVIKAMGAQRAFMFIDDSPMRELQNGLGRDSLGNDVLELNDFSSTVISNCRAQRQTVFVNSTGNTESATMSIVLNDLKLVMATPLLAKDKLIGVLYLDTKVDTGNWDSTNEELLAGIANQLAVTMEISRATQNELLKKKLEKDLEVTSVVQKLLLPKSNQIELPWGQLNGYMKSATQSGGDWWWYQRLSEDKLLIFVGDVTGHGAGPAMVTAILASTFKTILAGQGAHFDIKDAINAMNRTILEICQGEFLVSLSTILIDRTESKFHWWASGAPPILLHRKGQAIEELSEAGSLLGMERFETGYVEVNLAAGDRIYAFTDGAYEIELPEGRHLGVRKLSRMILAKTDLSFSKLSETLVQDLQKISGQEEFEDDVSILCFEYKP